MVTSAAAPRHRRRGAAARPSWSAVAIALMAIAGLVVVMYPSIASWFSARAQTTAVDAYTEEVENAAPELLQGTLAQAHDYNAAIPEILLSDPYTVEDAMSGRGGAYETYQQQLVLNDADTGTLQAMARIRIPSIGVELPVFHGTEDAVLERGAGHLFGSSLPVGGPDTHTVITAHAGLVEATMFDNLTKVAVGDEVTIDVLGEHLTYRVTGTQTVLPTEVSALRLAPGKDQLTLITCTPIGINSHRLLVHAERVEDLAESEAAAPVRTQVATASQGPGFPWWSVHLAGGIVVILGLVLTVDGRARRGSDDPSGVRATVGA